MTFTLSMPRPSPELLPGDVILTGDRPTGPLHLGHLAGSLATRCVAQDVCSQTVLVADMQALTDHAHDPARVRTNVLEVVKDYLAVGIDPGRTDIALQSSVPELTELTAFMMTVVGEGRAMRNPTVKAEIEAKSFSGGVPLAFVVYPVSQAADIIGFGATAVPVGDDQKPMIDLAREISASLRRMGAKVASPRGVYPVGVSGRLPGVDGRKASKTFGNSVPLGSERDEIAALVRRMVSDPGRASATSPGNPDVTVTFAYLRAFDPDRDGLAALEEGYRRGDVGDSLVKARVVEVLDALLAPVRERRNAISNDEAMDALTSGTVAARARAHAAVAEVKEAFGILSIPGARSVNHLRKDRPSAFRGTLDFCIEPRPSIRS